MGTRHLLNANQGPARASIISSLALPIQLAETKRAAFSLDSFWALIYRPRDERITNKLDRAAMWSSWQRVLGLLSLASSAHANANPNIDVQYSAPVSSTRVLLNDGHSMPAVSLGTCCGQAGDLLAASR